MIYQVIVEDLTFEIEISDDQVRIDGEAVFVDLAALDKANEYSLILEGSSQPIHATKQGRGTWDILSNKRSFHVNVLDRLGRAIRGAEEQESQVEHPEVVIAPMPGTIVDVKVKEGDSVEAGQGLVIVEAMKMENSLKAERDAIISKVYAIEGQVLEQDDLIIEFEPNSQ